MPQLTNTWFAQTGQATWDLLLPHIQPRRVLEIGSYEGASAVHLVGHPSRTGPLELHCVDTWAGGVEHGGVDMAAVEARFTANLDEAIRAAPHPVSLFTHRDLSHRALARLIAGGREGAFDFIYVDGSHQAPDVLADAVLAFRLLRVGGVMCFDDYLWSEDLPGGRDPLRCPKPAVDAFVNIHFRKVRVLQLPPYQQYVEKLAD